MFYYVSYFNSVLLIIYNDKLMYSVNILPIHCKHNGMAPIKTKKNNIL